MTVFLVGAGPGDPGLLTVRGAEVLGRADVVVYDRLSVASLLDLAPERAERINVGKAAGEATMPQADINALLVERGRSGATVVRLKGGDPFVFARGGEEAQALLDAGVPFEVVPGISSAVGVPAYAGIPVTLRHSSELFTVITGHEDPAKGGALDWEAVARLGGTIVVLMGVGRRREIADRLIAGGLDPATPVAAIRWGTRPEQQTVRATLGTLADQPLEPPATIVIGAVAGLDLRWYEAKPLFGKRVVVTRTADQAPELARRLHDLGAEPVVVPVIELRPPPDGGDALRELATVMHRIDWVVFTSPNGVDRFCAELRDARDFTRVQIAAIGPGTADALARHNLVADLVPERYVAESLLAAFPPPNRVPGSHGVVALVRALHARDVLPVGLAEMGWTVDVVPAYETVAAAVDDGERARVRGADVVTFTSSSTVVHFVQAFGIDAAPPVVACIGPVTAATAREHGLHVDVVAEEHTIPGLLDALVAHLMPPRG